MRSPLVVLCLASALALAGCSTAVPAPEPSTPVDARVEVPSEPSHPPYVPSSFFPPGTTGPGIWDARQVPIVVAASIDGIGYPLPPGAAYDGWEDVDPNVGFEIGTIESGVAFQWHCAWLVEWDAASDAGDDELATDIEALLEQFWTLPHITLLTDGEGTFREQQTAAAPPGADLNRWFLHSLCD